MRVIDLLPFALVYGASVPFDYFVLRRARSARTWYWAELLILLALPLTIPATETIWRFYAAFFAALKMVRVAEMVYGKVLDQSMLATPGRFGIWISVQGDATWPKREAEKALHRKEGLALIGEGLAYLGGLAGLQWLLQAWTGWRHDPFARGLVFMVVMGVAAPGIVGLLNGLVMAATGVRISRAMNHPLLGRSIGDFWGKRWNIAFRDTAYRLVFAPLRARGVAVVPSVLAVFVFSAIAHEYLVFAVLGRHLGIMGSFFLAQGLLSIGERALQAKFPSLRNPVLSRILLWAALIATAPLFFGPFVEMVPLDQIIGE